MRKHFLQADVSIHLASSFSEGSLNTGAPGDNAQEPRSRAVVSIAAE